MCACGRASRSALSAGRVRMKSPIAPPRITRMRFICYCSGALCAPGTNDCLFASAVIPIYRDSLVLRKCITENHTTVSQRDRMQTAPAKSSSCAPINLIAKNVRNRHPKQPRDNQQVSKNRHEQAAWLVAQKGCVEQRFGGQ